MLNKIEKNNNEIALKKIILEILFKFKCIEDKEDILKLLNFKLNLEYPIEKNKIYNFLFNTNSNPNTNPNTNSNNNSSSDNKKILL